MKKLYITIFLLYIIIISGCKCSCNCELCLTCTKLTATWSANDSVIVMQEICSTVDDRIDTAYTASEKRFYSKYNSSSYKIIRKDSIVSCNNIKIGCHSSDPEGYFCYECPK